MAEENIDDEMGFEEEEKAVPTTDKIIPMGKRGRPPSPAPKPQIKAELQERYQPYHIAEQSGVIDVITQKPVSADIIGILAVMLNKIQRIEEATIG